MDNWELLKLKRETRGTRGLFLGNLNDEIEVPALFRSGTQKVSKMRIVIRIAEIEAKRDKTDADFEAFKERYNLR